jgi:Oxidoreductase-like protein, N-terminal
MSRPFLMDQPLSDRDSAQALISQVQVLAEQQGLALRPPPAEPTTCCGRGCNGCVWEGYFGAVNYWHEEAMGRLGPSTAG